MTDTFSPEQRSEIMRRVKSRNTSLELKVRSTLHKRGLRFRLNYPLPGKPDIVFVKAKIAIFLDSCFWHGCPEHLRMPQSNRDYWLQKIKRNVERDKKINIEYANSGWKILRFWEHEMKGNFGGCIQIIENAILNAVITRS